MPDVSIAAIAFAFVAMPDVSIAAIAFVFVAILVALVVARPSKLLVTVAS